LKSLEFESSASTSPGPLAEQLASARRLYVDLLKRALTHTNYWPVDVTWDRSYILPEFDEAVKAASLDGPLDFLTPRTEGRDWPKFAQTMVGYARLDNVERCVTSVLEDDVPGDLIEAGVWRGGVAIFMRGLLEAFADTTRCVYAADSFAGLPPPSGLYPEDDGDTHHLAPRLAIPREDVERNFALYQLLDERVRLVEGWFSETLPALADKTWSVVRIDGDMYESTIDALKHLYPRLSPGGYLIIDDWSHIPCRKAVEDYRSAHGITEPIEVIDWTGVFWRREQ
jgi:O-methyltransferase